LYWIVSTPLQQQGDFTNATDALFCACDVNRFRMPKQVEERVHRVNSCGHAGHINEAFGKRVFPVATTLQPSPLLTRDDERNNNPLPATSGRSYAAVIRGLARAASVVPEEMS
jgi:hypothetical protein